MSIDPDILKKVSTEVYRKFPAVDGSRPKVQSYPNDGYLLIFQGSGRTDSGASISTVVRAVVSNSGRITKITTSR